jgi:predicted O-linked N-acetylglucosamine transferase (SPINDLY family)
MTAAIAGDLALVEERLSAGRPDEAIVILERSANRHPEAVDVHLRLAELREAVGRLEPAIASYRTVLGLRAQPLTYGRLGVALCQVGRFDEAAAAFESALALDAGFIDARVNLGMVRIHSGDTGTGRRLFRQAIGLKPDHADSWQAMASAVYALGEEAEAAGAAERALALAPAHGMALAVSALLHRRRGEIGRAYRVSRRAAALDPRHAEMLAVVAVTLRDIGDGEAAVRVFRRALAINPQHADARAAMIMCLNFVSSAAPADLLAEARLWAELHALPRRDAARAAPATVGPLRIGLVSGDLQRHAVGYFLCGVMPHVDPGRVRIHCFPTTRANDALTAKIRTAAAGWYDIATASDEIAFELIRRQGIDILVDMSGYTAGSRLSLFALKPAPVQAAWIGYFGTTGLAAIDWLIADDRLVPAGQERWFSERILRLPDSYVCYEPPATAPAVAPPPSDDKGYITFGSCNALAKITPATIAAWARILTALPDARLLLKNGAFDAEAARSNLRRAFQRHGIAGGRLVLEGWSAYGEFLDTYARIDVALDPFPFCGGLTTVETLWMGVPLVSLAADRFAGRQSLSYLTTIGHPELCAANEDEYVAKAVALARDPEARRHLRQRLRPDMAASPLLDGPRFARNLEAAFETMAGRRA